MMPEPRSALNHLHQCALRRLGYGNELTVQKILQAKRTCARRRAPSYEISANRTGNGLKLFMSVQVVCNTTNTLFK